MRHLVIVITDLYLCGETVPASADATARLPGIEYAGRFGARTALAQGWRSWLARLIGREDLAGVAPAPIAASVLGSADTQPAAPWIATPVHLSAALARVHLDHRGLLRLSAEQLASLAQSFAHTFAGSGLSLAPLPCGEFLLLAPALALTPTIDPARCAGGEIAPALPQGREAAPLRRTATEIEMWLHGLDAAAHGLRAVNALWLWGAGPATVDLRPRASAAQMRAFGADPYVCGLWHLQGSACRPLPENLDAVLSGAEERGAVLTVRVADELQESPGLTFTEAVGRLDARFISPALRELRRGALECVTLIANDTALALRRGSGRKLWRRARAGLAGFA